MSTLRASRPVAVLLLVTLWPALGLAQSAPPAGVVTGIQGRASLVRPVVAQPIPLKFKDDLFLRDQVETRENSVVRVLLGGKALVTIRELSTFAITEEPGRAVVDLKSGKIAVGVAKSLLKPGEAIEIRTPNAIAAVRGSLLIASVVVSGGVTQSSFTALDASLPITVTPLTGSMAPVALNTNQAVGVSGIGASTSVGPVQNITPDVARREAQTVAAPRAADGQGASSPMAAEISAAKAQEATALASLIAPPPTGATPPPADATLASATQTQLLQEPGSTVTAAAQTVVSTTPPPPSTGDLGVNAGAAENISSGSTSPPPPAVVDNPDLTIANTTVALQPGQTLKTYTGVSNRAGSSPVVQITNSQVTGPANLIEVAPGADATIAGSVLQMTGPSVQASSLGAGSSVIDIRGRLETTTAASLVDIDPTLVTAANMFSIIGGNLVLAGPLLTDAGGAYALTGDMLAISGGGILSGSSPAGLVQLSNSTVGAGRIFSVAGGSATLAGPLLSATNSVIGTTSDFADVLAGGVLTTIGTSEPLFSLSGGTVTVGGPRNQLLHVRGFQAGGSVPAVMSLSGPLLSVSGTPIVSSGNLVRIADGGSITGTATSPLLSFTAGGFTGGVLGTVSGGSLLRMFSEVGQSGSTLTLGGPYLVSSGANFATQDGTAFNIADGAVITKTGSSPFLSFANGSVISSGSFFSATSNTSFTIPGSPPTVGSGVSPSITLGGPLLTASNASLTSGDPTANTNTFIFVADGSVMTSTGSGPLLSFDASSVDTAGNIFTLRRSRSLAERSRLVLAGPLFSAVNGSSFNTSSLGLGAQFGIPGAACCPGFSIQQGAQLISTTAAPLIQLSNSTFSAGPDAQSGGNFFQVQDTFAGFPAGELTAPGSVSLAGPLLRSTDSTISTLFALLNVANASFSSTTGDPLIQFQGGTATLGGVDLFAPANTLGRVLTLTGTAAAPATLTLQGPLFKATNTTIATNDDVFGVFNGSTLTSTSTNPLIQVSGGSVTGGPTGLFFIMASGAGLPSAAMNLSGPLLSAGSTSIKAGDPTLNTSGSILALVDSATLVSTTTAPLLFFDNTVVDTTGNVVVGRRSRSLPAPTSLTLSGPLFSAVNGSSFNTTSLGNGAGGVGVPGTACCSGFFIGQAGQLTSTGTGSLIQLANSTFSAGPDAQSGGPFFFVGDTFGGAPGAELIAPASVSLNGSLLSATNSTVSALFSLLSLTRSNVISTSTDPLIQLSGSTVTLGGFNPFPLGVGSTGNGSILSMFSGAGGSNAPTVVSLQGPLLQATNSTLNLTAVGVGVFNGATLLSAGTVPFVTLDTSSLTTGLGAGGDFLNVSGLGGALGTTPSSASFAGALLHLTNGSSLTLQRNVIIGSQNPSITGTGSSAFVQVDGGSSLTMLAAGGAGEVAGLFNGTTLSLQGGLLSVSGGGTLTAARGLVNISNGSQLTALSVADPLASITGGVHSIGATFGGSLFTLFGTATAVDPDTGLTLGTDRPIQGVLQPSGTRPIGTSLLETSGATITGEKFARFDTMLLEATAPLLSAKTASVITSSTDAVDLSQRARVTALGTELIRLDASTFKVNNGVLVNVAGGSKLTVGGNLVSLLNGAMLNVSGGPLLSISGGSFASIGGALVSFGGTGGNTVNVINALAPTGFINGVPVFSSLGGTTGFTFTNSTPLVGLNTLGTITINGALLPNSATATSGITGSLIGIQGTGGQVKIGP